MSVERPYRIFIPHPDRPGDTIYWTDTFSSSPDGALNRAIIEYPSKFHHDDLVVVVKMTDRQRIATVHTYRVVKQGVSAVPV